MKRLISWFKKLFLPLVFIHCCTVSVCLSACLAAVPVRRSTRLSIFVVFLFHLSYIQPNIKRQNLCIRSCNDGSTKSRQRIPTEWSFRLIRWMDFRRWLLFEPDNPNFKIVGGFPTRIYLRGAPRPVRCGQKLIQSGQKIARRPITSKFNSGINAKTEKKRPPRKSGHFSHDAI